MDENKFIPKPEQDRLSRFVFPEDAHEEFIQIAILGTVESDGTFAHVFTPGAAEDLWKLQNIGIYGS